VQLAEAGQSIQLLIHHELDRENTWKKAVIVPPARTGLAKSWKGAFNYDARHATSAVMSCNTRGRAPRHRSGRSRDVLLMGYANQARPASTSRGDLRCARAFRSRCGRNREIVLFVRPAGDDGRAA
jgi:hypothetical protein